MASSNQTSNSLLKEDTLASVLKTLDDLISGRLVYPPRITKYELARIIAARAKQLSMGAQPLVNPQELGTYDPIDIALEEVRRGLLPFIIVRTLPNGRHIRIKLKDLLDLSEKFDVKL
ncbi:DNA-directed RNA polymerase subunit K [Vulcanisaeta souniana]|uniref:DNA-directed RNA polymerase subunit Rpo6 n=1 Tax=Vulcanisaeta souniana JCM 11219 TaxID=1293586 RepID=A0A830E4U6_9CREN|nr:DNA-directed RNA polymerase subunit K [Vulcanisaeta souniana]BDR91759.1 DNA-directed RNA polymerase subunit K [Vulcanisaeta souniana JCM 11219]GGI70602.1 DNA-directed RNA polymerase subunit K [Vulcanisaeta souniana JCM 11219]